MANRTTLAHLSLLLYRHKPEQVLELGAGIGTMTDALLVHPAGIKSLVTTEDNEYCLSVLRGNLTNPEDPRLLVAVKISDIPESAKFDLVVGDGGFAVSPGVCYTPWRQVGPGTVAIMEGNRSRLRAQFVADLAKVGRQLPFQEYGVVVRRQWRPSDRLARLGLKIPLPLKTRGEKGCWIGFVS